MSCKKRVPGGIKLTFMKHVTHRTVVQDQDLTEVWLHAAQVFNIRPIPIRTMLAVVAGGEKFALLLQPVNDRVGVFLHAGCKDDKLEPFAHFPKKVVAVGPLVHIIEDRVLRAEGLVADSDGRI